MRSFIELDDFYLDEDEIKEALEEGYKKIDLDLINYAEKGNAIKVWELLKQGANHLIDPFDNNQIGLIHDVLGSDSSFHGIMNLQHVCHEKDFDPKERYSMLSDLYQSGVSDYILEMILNYGENRKMQGPEWLAKDS